MERVFLCACLVMSCTGSAEPRAALLQTGTGPIGQAVREAGRLIEVEPKPTVPSSTQPGQRLPLSDWWRVTRLRSGTEIKLTSVTASDTRGYVVHVDHSALTVLNVAHLSLPAGVRKVLREVAREDPAALMGGSWMQAGVRIGPDGVFYEGRKLVDLIDVVLTFRRSDVLQVRSRERRGSGWGALAGGFVGFVVGVQAGLALGLKQCGRSCSDEGVLMTLSFIGLPIATGVAGYHLATHTVDVIVYRASRP